MKRLRSVVFYTFIVSTLATIAFAFWFFSGQPSKEQIAKAFPLNSYQIFTDGKKLTLYSIEPVKASDGAETFRDYSVIGKTEVNDRSFQKLLKQAFLNDSANKGEGPECFNPTHGLRIIDDKEILNILISYECKNFIIFIGDNKGEGNLKGNSKGLLDRVLADAGVPL